MMDVQPSTDESHFRLSLLALTPWSWPTPLALPLRPIENTGFLVRGSRHEVHIPPNAFLVAALARYGLIPIAGRGKVCSARCELADRPSQ